MIVAQDWLGTEACFGKGTASAVPSQPPKSTDY